MSLNKTEIFKSEVQCLKDVENYNFSIPTYQRPYVWGDEQLKKIIDDFYKAFQKNKQDPYYISTLITKDNGENDKKSELIDGQQRFTTLWLIALVISRLTPNHKSEINHFLKKDDELRLSFEIRREVYNYLIYILDGDQEAKTKIAKDVESYPYLKNITKAIKSIDGFIKDALNKRKSKLSFEEELQAFGNYIYTKVFFVKNTTPLNADLNKIFSTINNSGVQLEQTDIVKANLLNVIGNEKVMYSKIWESCENMSNFFERNIRFAFPQSNWQSINLSNDFEFDPSIYKYKKTESDAKTHEDKFNIDEINIDEIADYKFDKAPINTETDREESEEIYCRSIISFGQLLLHTYRLHLKQEKKEDFTGTFHVNRLIEVFKELEKRNDSEEVKRFFKLLWSIRYLFDKYVIKWISDTNTKDEALEIVRFTRNEKSHYTRTPYPKSASLMLQSVLYFTGDYLRQYWLSSYLDYLYYNHKFESPTSGLILSYLEKIDNVFSLSKELTDKDLSWKMMHQLSGFENDLNFKEYLNQPHGTGFKHYWFYKLEYLLWKNWTNKEDEKYKKYRITSKNSVEHIYPQNPENEIEHPILEPKYLDSFGNLVLLSVSQNSEYSNKSVSVKKSMFYEKRVTYDSLKSYNIFNAMENLEWNKDAIIKHRDEMIELFKNHYQSDDSKKEQTSINVENSNQNNDHSIENTNLNDENNATEIENETIPNIHQNNNVMCIPGFNKLSTASFIGCYRYLNNNNATRVSLTYGFYRRTNANCQSPGYIKVNPNHIFTPIPNGWYFGVNLRIRCQGNAGINNNQVLIANKVYLAFNQKFVVPKYMNNYADMGVDFFIVPNLSKEKDQELKKEINADELGNNIHEETGLNDDNFEEWLKDKLNYLEDLYNQAIKTI